MGEPEGTDRLRAPIGARGAGGLTGLRLVLIGLSVVLGIAAISAGRPIIGAVVLVMAAVRLAMVARFHRMRHERLARRQDWLDSRRRGA